MSHALQYFKKEDWERKETHVDSGAMPFVVNKIIHKKTGAQFWFDPQKGGFAHEAIVRDTNAQREFLKAREIAYILFRKLDLLYTIPMVKQKKAKLEIEVKETLETGVKAKVKHAKQSKRVVTSSKRGRPKKTASQP